MIKRQLYMKRIRPFIGSDLVKVMTGIRRCGKSVMLELIKDELKASGVDYPLAMSMNAEEKAATGLMWTALRRLHYRFECQTVVRRTCYLSWWPIC